jgi:tetratricopeptide (TPR) repeat protein
MSTDSPHTGTILQQGLALHRKGQLDEARALYEQALLLQPESFEALHLLGLIAFQAHDPAQAADLFRKALLVNPDSPIAHHDYGSAQSALGKHRAALVSYDDAIALDPEYALAHYNRGNTLFDLGMLESAVASYERAISLKPDYPLACNNLGVALLCMKDYGAALSRFDDSVVRWPGNAETHNYRAHALRELKRLDEATESCLRAISIKEDFAEAHANLGLILQETGDADAASSALNRAINLRPEFFEAHVALGGLFLQTGQWQAALSSYDRAVALKPNDTSAHCGRGMAFYELGQLDQAITSFNRAIAIRADCAAAYVNRGGALVVTNLVDAALASYDRALVIDGNSPAAHFGRSMVLLLRGDLAEGWQEYEWRWKFDLFNSRERRSFAQPLWLGRESLAGKTILLCAEQGLGDTIQFCRYATLVARSGARVILEAPEALTGLLRSLEGVASIVARGDALPSFDYYCPLMSLPLAFGTNLSNIPGHTPYLHATSERRRYWADKLGAAEDTRVGLVWSGGFWPNKPDLWSVNKRRNMPLAKLAPLRHSDCEFYSLQKGQHEAAELAKVKAEGWDGPELRDHTGELKDFADTAAFMHCLDLIISVDTATAHLAGALGKPVWILNRFDTEWRWMLNRDDSPWYPTARVYRQKRPGDWDEVIQRLHCDLQRFATHDAI